MVVRYDSFVSIISQSNLTHTGESGSGKTEASKLLLLFLGNVFQSSSEIENVVDTVIKSNYILESFGNAVTNCNDNSSRFGKFMEISFVRDDQHHNYDCSFATIHDYLLEKVIASHSL